MTWDKWEPWGELYREWERRMGRKRIVLTYPSLKGLWQWFAREVERREIDPAEIDVESYLDPTLTVGENKEILKTIMTSPITDFESEELYEEAKARLQEQVRTKYPEILEPLEERIIELERTEITSKRRYKKIKALELALAESERRREEEKQALEAKMAPVKIRVLRPFTEGIIDYTVDSVLEVRDVDWILNKISAGLVERVEIEVPVKRVPPPPPPMELTKEQKTSLEDAYRRAFIEAGVLRFPPLALAAFRDELIRIEAELNAVPQEKIFPLARSAVLDLASSIIKEIKPPVPPPVPVAPPAVVVPAVEMLGPRRRIIETFTCWVPECLEPCILDRDLMERVSLVPVMKAITPRGPRREPLLTFPPSFYYTCEKHRQEKFGYKNIYDVLAFLMFESRSSGKRLTITKGTFTAAGLDAEDIANIQVAAARWMPS